MFSDLKKQVSDNFNRLAKSNRLFYVEIDRDEIWEKYFSGFPVEFQQENNCNCCKSFLRQYGGIVSIVDNQVVSLWDGIECSDEYAVPVQKLRSYIHSRPVTDIFLNSFAKCGTDKNLDSKRNIVWNHFFIELPKTVVVRGSVPALLGEARTNKEVFKRSLEELTLDATETVLELISQNSLYRGTEFKGVLESFLKYQRKYSTILPEEKDNYCWTESQSAGMVAKIRNTAIGTLLIDISNGLELDDAVKKFHAVMAPGNYQRPTALSTPKMIEKAKADLKDAGLLDSLNRRYANDTDISVSDIIYQYTPSNKSQDVFDLVAGNVPVNPKTFATVETVSIEDFIRNVVPTAKTIEVLVENAHKPNFVSLITAQDPESKGLFKWNNPFSWSYAGGVADSMKERVKSAGGKVDGVLRFSIQWNEDGKNDIDFDAHCVEPNRNEIYYGNCRKPQISTMRGQLDVDILSPGYNVAVENITWDSVDSMQKGVYKFFVQNFSSRLSSGGFSAEIEFGGQIFEFDYPKNLSGHQTIQVAKVTYLGNGEFTIKSLLDSKSAVNSSEVWGVSTNKFTKVTKIMLSPNHWENSAKIGNKHYFFILQNTVSTDTPRPFLNEFLMPELTPHRKVMEMVGSKLVIEPTNHQLSGVGFSDTQRNHLIVRVTGKFKRTLKINF
jgi:hypothetical protein